MDSTDPQVLLAFLERMGPEVSGHHWPEPDREAALKLARFTRGECDEGERDQICRLLRARPTWLRWVANLVKGEREQDGRSAGATA